jgi:hypothetical protein
MKFVPIFILVLICGCSLAPISTPRSAQSLGKNKNKIEVMPIIPVLGFNYQRGISENLDLGFSIEQQLAPVASGFFKYSFINQPQDFSLASTGGLFYGSGIVNTKGLHLGLITSYRKKWFEAFLYPRYNHLQWDGSNLTSDQEDSLVIDIINYTSKMTIQYAQIDIGFNFYTSSVFNFGFGASYLYFLSVEHIDQQGGTWIPEIFLGWKF